METNSKIIQFYERKCVFITGATGFMGKVLVEKLLRSCPDIDKIFLLLRPAKGKDVSSRLQEFIQSQVDIFLKMIFRKKKPSALSFSGV